MDEIQGPQAPYKRIAAKIKAQIDNGELQPGEAIPSARQLVKTEGVSLATATRVAATLRAEGYAVTTQGIGTVASRPKKLTAGADRLHMLRAGGTGLGDDERTEILDAELQPASQEVADALGLGSGDEVARRRRRYIDSQGVVAVSATWIAGALARELPEFTATEKLPKMTFGLIEDRTGRRATRRRDAVSVRPVPADVAGPLDVDEGTQVLVMVNHYWDQHGEPTEYAVDYHAPGRELVMEHDPWDPS